MASPNTKTFSQLLQDQAAAIQGAGAGLIDFSVGSVLRAISEANAMVGMWLQGLILILLQTTRLATSSGSDVDSFVADFGLTREGAVAASGAVTFSRITGTVQTIVPVGGTVQTIDGTQSFVVTADPTNAAYSEDLGGYVLGSGTLSVTVPVEAQTPGSGGNAAAGAIGVITSAMTGVDTVSNALAFTNGANAETDGALKLRFISYLASLSKATLAAVIYAIQSLQQGISQSITENMTYAGTVQQGHFSAVIDDGTGAPSSAFLNAQYKAIDAVRPISVTFEVHGPTILTAAVSMTVEVAEGYTASDVTAAVQASLQAFIGSLAMSQTLPYSRLPQLAYDASAGVTNVTNVLLNGATADLVPTTNQRVRPGTITVASA